MITDNASISYLLLATVACPLVSAVLCFLLRRSFGWVAPMVSTLLLAVSMVTAIILVANGAVSNSYSYWFDVGSTQIPVATSLNYDSGTMILMVTLVSFLVSLYSAGYMAHDPAMGRYFSLLGLFTFSMIGLALSRPLQLSQFAFWELVGICSYLLIGHFRQKASAVSAATKAFLFNRIADVAFLAGVVFILSIQKDASSDQRNTILTVCGFCLFAGAVGKSGQFPLISWLPSAMEGPTPVSAMIHAATMVAAGVYALVQFSPQLTPPVLVTIGIIGTITAIYGAVYALVQFDLKKVLAYSTVSQLGLMMMAIGVNAPGAAFIHLISHAMFKACLFLAAGAIIHALRQSPTGAEIQDMRMMGGLRKKMPTLFICFCAAAASLVGLPFFSGFVSKEIILWGFVNVAWGTPGVYHWFLFISYFVISLLTAFYATRMVWMVFLGPPRVHSELRTTTPAVMTAPIVLLAILSLWFVHTINPFGSTSWIARQPTLNWTWLLVLSICWPLAAVIAAYLFLRKRSPTGRILSSPLDSIHPRFVAATLGLASLSDWLDGAIIDRLLHRAVYFQVGLAKLVGWFDHYLVDGLVNVAAGTAKSLGNMSRRLAGGKIQQYIYVASAGLIIFILWLLQ